MFHTKKQRADIQNCHIGSGVLIYRSSTNEITEINFFIHSNGKLCASETGKEIEFDTRRD